MKSAVNALNGEDLDFRFSFIPQQSTRMQKNNFVMHSPMLYLSYYDYAKKKTFFPTANTSGLLNGYDDRENIKRC
ncbi:hypothetical protein V6N13_087572 [Hibiscus sabdariffa]